VPQRDLAPQELLPGLRADLEAFAAKNGLVVNDVADHKIEWVEQHGRRCFCDWSSGRICPCHLALEDIKRLNGTCLCNVLHTPERHQRYLEQRTRVKKVLTEEEKAERKKKRLAAKLLAQKVLGKKKKRKGG
jgi:hypothetical protein